VPYDLPGLAALLRVVNHRQSADALDAALSFVAGTLEDMAARLEAAGVDAPREHEVFPWFRVAVTDREVAR
jgi:hypothetical protein